MQGLRVKSTVLRSNPQIIREFWIESERTLDELYDVIRIALGWKAEKAYSLEKDGKTISGREKLEDIFHQGEHMHLFTGKCGQWNIFAQVLEEAAEYEGDCPRMVRYHGDNPPQDCETMKDLNLILAVWSGNNTAYRYAYAQKSKKRQIFSQAKTDRQLRRRFCPQTAAQDNIIDAELNEELKIPLQEVFNSWTSSSLERMVTYKRLSVRYSSNKQQMIRNMLAFYQREEFWREILRKMSLAEYRRLRKLCFSEETEQGTVKLYDLDTLDSYMLICETYDGDIRIAGEFLDFYQQWLEAGNEEKYIECKKVETAIIAGCRLYGMVDQSAVKTLLDACYPEKWDKEQFDAYWKACEAAENSVCRVQGGKEFYYDVRDISKTEAKQLVELLIQRQPMRYVPTDRTWLETAADQGMQFDENAKAEFESFFERELGVSEQKTEALLAELYRGLHIEVEESQLLSFVSARSGLRKGTAKEKRLEQLLRRHKGSVRLMRLLGYTADEYVNILPAAVPKTKAGKIYPNAPCPCGSGKKYKMCCGRNAGTK